ncbi:MAG: hypothetical protein ABI841_07770 [Chloroflexota bacterium]
MDTLRLARGWYGVLGLGTLLLTGGHVVEGVRGGSRLDIPIVALGILLGLLALSAAAWVVTPDRTRGVIAWAGILGGAVAFLYAFWLAATTAAMDAVLFAGVPTVIALAAAARMAWARAKTTA